MLANGLSDAGKYRWLRSKISQLQPTTFYRQSRLNDRGSISLSGVHLTFTKGDNVNCEHKNSLDPWGGGGSSKPNELPYRSTPEQPVYKLHIICGTKTRRMLSNTLEQCIYCSLIKFRGRSTDKVTERSILYEGLQSGLWSIAKSVTHTKIVTMCLN